MSDCCNYFEFTDPGDSFQSWMGLRGPAGPAGAPGPQGPPGTGLYISGTVATVEDLPETAPQGTMYNVGTEAPYTIYLYQEGQGWISQGQLEGPPGPAGPAGPAGADGAPGTPGAAATIAVGTVSGLPAGSTPTVTNSGSSSAAVFNFGIPAGATGATGPQGPQGEPGRGLTISGTVATTAQLPATAEQGTVYNVGASEPYELYMYETGTGWISLGYLEGPEGPQGEPGAAGSDGTTFTPSVSAAGVISWTNDGGKTNPQPVNIKGPQGDPGAAGAPGAAGSDGTTFTPSVSSAGVISWTNDGGKTNPDPVNIKGPQGETGSAGAPGAAATIAVGTVSVLPAGSTPTVTNSGSSSAAIFDFGIPAGTTGPQGPQGDAAVTKIAISLGTSWSGSGPYTQIVTVPGATANSKVSLQLTSAQASQLIQDGVIFLQINNNNGTFTAEALGAAPSTAMTIQATRVEVTT